MRASQAIAWIPWLLASALPALTQQEPAQRRPMRALVGIVVDGEARPLPGATVVVAHVPDGEESLPAHHHGKATTDARGRFHVEAPSGVDLRVFAIGPVDDDGGHVVSEVVATTASKVLTLRATERMPIRSFRLTHPERWREFAPLRLRVLPAGAELPGYEQPIGDDGTLELPLLPLGYTTFEVLSASGVLGTSTISSTRDVVMDAQPVWDVPIELVDEQGRPVPGALVQQNLTSSAWTARGLLPNRSLRQSSRRLGTSDADGRLLARIPRADDPFGKDPGNGLLVWATAPGHLAAAAGIFDRPFEGTSIRKAGETARGLQLVLTRGTPPRVRLHWAGTPLPGTRLHAMGKMELPSGNPRHTLWWLDVAITDADGVATFPNLPAGVSTAWLSTSDFPAAGRGSFAEGAPAPRLVLPPMDALGTGTLDVNLASFCKLHLRVLDLGGAPAQGTRLVVLPAEATPNSPPVEFPVDPAGQLAALMPRDQWRVLAMDGEHCTFAPLAENGRMPQVLQFRPKRLVEGKILDARGKVVGGAVAEWVAIESEAGALGPLLSHLLANPWWSQGPIESSSDGSFRILVPDVAGCTPWLRFSYGGRHSAEFAVEGTEPIELVIPDR